LITVWWLTRGVQSHGPPGTLPQRGLSRTRVQERSGVAGFEQAAGDVDGESPAAEGCAAEVFQAFIENCYGAVGDTRPVEEREDISVTVG
jgi:hypothetical protein